MNNQSNGDGMPNGNEHETPFRAAPSDGGYPRNSMHPNESAPNSPFNFWTALDLLSRRWGWLFLAALIGAGGLLALGVKFIKPKYTASAQLMRYETPVSKE